MSEEIIKLKCPACKGKVAIDKPYYQDLEGTDISCPHCSGPLHIPPLAQLPEHTATAPEDMRRTHKLQLIPVDLEKDLPHPPAAKQGPTCPHCGASVGERDRICMSCENKLDPK